MPPVRISNVNPHRKTKLLAATLLCSLGLLAGCAGDAQPGPTAVPLRPTATADFETEDLESLMQQMLDEGSPAVLVEVRDGDEVWSHAVGVQSVRSDAPATPTDHARIASLTKPMVATIVLQLVDEGHVKLDDEIEQHLPGVVDGRKITVAQLLDHTSGVPDYVPVLAAGDPLAIPDTLKDGKSSEELVDLALQQPWINEPGEGYFYSNTNYVVLTMLIEKLTGQPLHEVFDERIAEPLGLDNTSIPDGDGMPEPRINGYWIDGSLTVDVTEQDSSLWVGAGGVVSTVSDVNTFMRGLMTGQLLPPELLGYMLRLNDDGYGLGIQSRGNDCAAPNDILMPVQSPEGADPGIDETVTPNPAPETATPGPTSVDVAQAATRPGANSNERPVSDVLPEVPESGSGSLIEYEGDNYIQIGQSGMVYGHLGSGLGYRALTMTSADGLRQVTVFWNASTIDFVNDPRLDIAYDLVDAGLRRAC